MNPLLVATVNQSTVYSDADCAAETPALVAQINEDLLPVWQVCPVQSVIVPRGGTIPPEADRIEYILDDPTQAGALGYHSDGSQEKVPTIYVFAKPTLSDGGTVSGVRSHEWQETAVDPFISYVVALDLQIGGFRGGYRAGVMLEVCDGPEADQFGYKKNGVAVSNFVTPSWFSLPWTPPNGYKGGGPLDFVGNVQAAFGLSNRGAPIGINPGGYISLFLSRVAKDWFSVNAAHSPSIMAIEKALPPIAPHVMKADGSLMKPDEICPYSRRGRWLARHGG